MSTTETMTIHKGLSELKVLGSRIEKAIKSSNYCIANKRSNKKINGISLDEFRANIKESYNSVEDLIKRQNAIKRAVVLSNAVTYVKVADTDYTVAEAIYMKNTGMVYKTAFLREVSNQYNAQAGIVNRKNEELSKDSERYVSGLYGGKDSQPNAEEVKKITDAYESANTYDLIDPLECLKLSEKMDKEISDFMSEIDAALSVSNAITTIVVTY